MREAAARRLVASASVMMSREARARAICCGDETLAVFEAATPARCMNWATPEVEYWIRFSITWPSEGCAMIHPMRQPVIAQFLENVLTNRMRSSPSITSR